MDIRNGLVADWRFDESEGSTAYDTHMWVDGKYGKALQFDGVDDYVEVPNDPSLNPTTEIRVEAWIKRLKGRTWQHPVSKGYSNQYEQYDIEINTSNEIYFMVKTDQGIFPSPMIFIDTN